MKKDIVNLGWFLLEHMDAGGINGDSLTIYSQSLCFFISGSKDYPEQVVMSVNEKQFSNVPLITQVVQMSEAENLIREIWKKTEEKNNSKFIEQHGRETYQEFYDSFLSALSGESENEKFHFDMNKNNEGLNISLKDKVSGITHLGFLSSYKNDYRHMLVGSAEINVTTLMENKTNDKYKYVTDSFQINIPTVDYYKYKLGLSMEKPYNKDNACEFLAKNLAYKDSQTLLSAFLLKSELNQDAGIHTKRPKI